MQIGSRSAFADQKPLHSVVATWAATVYPRAAPFLCKSTLSCKIMALTSLFPEGCTLPEKYIKRIGLDTALTLERIFREHNHVSLSSLTLPVPMQIGLS